MNEYNFRTHNNLIPITIYANNDEEAFSLMEESFNIPRYDDLFFLDEVFDEETCIMCKGIDKVEKEDFCEDCLVDTEKVEINKKEKIDNKLEELHFNIEDLENELAELRQQKEELEENYEVYVLGDLELEF